MVTQKFRTSELHQINLLTVQEVADWAKVSPKTIYRWISENKIPQFDWEIMPIAFRQGQLLIISNRLDTSI